MRAAPAVQVHLPRRGAWLGGLAVLSGLSAACFVAWAVQHAGIAATAFVAAAVAAWRFAPVDSGWLAWDGACWRFGAARGQPTVALDLGAWMLLRFRPDGSGRVAWLAAGVRHAGPQWGLLRAAVYCSPALRDDNERTPAPREPAE